MLPASDDRVLAATVTCLAEHGFQVSTATLAAGAQVGEATLFRRYRTKQALLAATGPYVLTQLTAAATPPQPGETLKQLLARWWENAAAVALREPALFACWCLWRTAAGAPPAVRYGPFAAARALLHQTLNPAARRALRLPTPAVVPTLAAQWLVAVELTTSGPQATAAEKAGDQAQRQAVFASWWASTGLADQLAAVPVPGRGAVSPPLTGLAALQQRYGLLPLSAPTGDFWEALARVRSNYSGMRSSYSA